MNGDTHSRVRECGADGATDAVRAASDKSDSASYVHTTSRDSRREPYVLQIEPCFGNVHVTEYAIPFGCAMPIRAAARHNVQIGRELHESNNVGGSVAWMPDFDTIESVGRQTRQTLACSIAPRMCPHRQRARRVCQTDRIGNVQPRVRHICRLAGTEVTVECFAVIRRVAGANQNASDVRSAECGTSRLGHNLVNANGYAGAGQAFDYGVSTLNTLALESFETRPDCAGVADMQSEQMYLEVSVVRTQLTSAHHSDSDTLTHRDCLIVAGDCVVVRYRDCLEVCSLGRLDKIGGGHSAIGGRRVRVQIDIALIELLRAALTHRA